MARRSVHDCARCAGNRASVCDENYGMICLPCAMMVEVERVVKDDAQDAQDYAGEAL